MFTWGVQTFQNGGYQSSKRYDSAVRLVDKSRSERCIFHNPNLQCRSKISQISLGGECVSVPMSSLWDNSSTMGVHKVNESPCKLLTTHGNEVDNISRRHTCHEPNKKGSFRRWEETQGCVREFRIPDKSQKIHFNTCARDRIFGVHNRFQFDDPIITNREDEKNKETVSNNLKVRCYNSKTTIRDNWKSDCKSSSSSASPSTLSLFTDGKKSSFETRSKITMLKSSYLKPQKRIYNGGSII